MAVYFRPLRYEKELKLLENFLLTQNMKYPFYEDWVKGVCIPEIEVGWKEVILAFYSQGSSWELIGNAIYQKAKEQQLPSTMHFKNMRVRKEFRREGIASFLIKQVEKAALSKGLEIVMLDFRKEKTDVMGLLLWHGYRKLAIKSLYEDNNLDVIMVKNLVKPEKRSFLIH